MTRLGHGALSLMLALIVLTGCTEDDPGTKAGGSGPPATLRIGTDDFPGTATSTVIEDFARRVEQLSGGEIRIKPVWHAAGRNVRAWDQRVMRLVIAGELDLGMIPARAWDTEGVTTLRALQAPFLITDDTLLDEVTGSPLAERMLAGLEDVGVVGLALVPDELRHPVGFRRPLLSLDDYAGARIQAPLSGVTFELLRALGAEPVNLAARDLAQARSAGTVRGMESGLARVGTFPSRGTSVTGNVVLFAKASTLVVNEERLETLPDDRQAALREAARQTLDYVRDTRPHDEELARRACAGETPVVLASLPQLAALKEAAHALYSNLERDPETRSLIADIEAMKERTPAANGAVACAPRDRAAGRASDPSILNGVWRSDPSYEEGVAAGLATSTAAKEMGLQTIRMIDGRYEWRWRARVGNQYCPGTYQVKGRRVRFTDGGECVASWEAEFRLLGDKIRWSTVRSHAADPEDQLVRELLHGEPWKKIG